MIVGSKVILREKKLSDARNDYIWETDPELAYLDAVPPVDTTFSQYLSEYASNLRNCPPTSCRLAVDTIDKKHIGNCSYYNINETRGETELGIMIGDRDYWDKGYGTAAVITLVNHIFRQTKIKRIYLKTLDSNERAQKCFRKCGFTRCGHMKKDGVNFTLMEIYRHQWQEQPTEIEEADNHPDS